MKHKGHMLGFDVRRSPVSLRGDWEAARRDVYLIVPSTPVPLSVDKAVWPSRFVLEGTRPVFGPNDDDIVVPGSELTRYFEHHGVFEGFGQLHFHHRKNRDGDCAIAIDVLDRRHYPEGFRPDRWYELLATRREPLPAPDPAWRFLGYDVAESGFLSGLCNCGRSPAARAQAEARWGADLGVHGLFADGERAAAFAVDADRAIPEHGPFYAMGIWLIWGDGLLVP